MGCWSFVAPWLVRARGVAAFVENDPALVEHPSNTSACTYRFASLIQSIKQPSTNRYSIPPTTYYLLPYFPAQHFPTPIVVDSQFPRIASDSPDLYILTCLATAYLT
ncbi:hypothetical protein Pst134EA_027831 [Puccinia striiformis f. sp. tritici]|uniref:hypothetical protein n=1 Tax=Puccinia striiformis f. sp. tritici TaxID=168172 RepID=UPI0020074A40|nr:hypothetical protein Pst134EA_027831 [Puccinia striiformis f. sp. tritici]KAH9442121.1 hypothetical protein Pst134EB_028385 [Puccinia striiformis f. sp. tritici]KAH9448520.1 hypothetical protein Pst134EA_027831 [Puccinia striiformis f. sp. tritici]